MGSTSINSIPSSSQGQGSAPADPTTYCEQETCSLCESNLTKAKYIMTTKFGIHTLCSKKCVAYFKKFLFESPKFFGELSGNSHKVEELCYLCLGSLESSHTDETKSISQDIATALCGLIGNGLGDAEKFLSEQYCFCCQTLLEQIRSKTFEVAKLKKELCDLRTTVLEMLLIRKADQANGNCTSRKLLQKHGIPPNTHTNESSSSEHSCHNSPVYNEEASCEREKTPQHDGNFPEQESQQKKEDAKKLNCQQSGMYIGAQPTPKGGSEDNTLMDPMDTEENSSDSDRKDDNEDAEDELSDSDSASEQEKSNADINYTVENAVAANTNIEHEPSPSSNPEEISRYTHESDINIHHEELRVDDENNMNESQIPESLELDYFGVENIASFLVIGQDQDDPCSKVDAYQHCATSGIGEEFFGSEESSGSTSGNELITHGVGVRTDVLHNDTTPNHFYSGHCDDSEMEKFCSTEEEGFPESYREEEVANSSSSRTPPDTEPSSRGVKRKHRTSALPRRKMQNKYICKTCNVFRCNWYSLVYHFDSKNHNQRDGYPCPLCNVTLFTLEEFKQHADSEHPGPLRKENHKEPDRKTRNCPKCFKVYYYGGSFDKHVKSCVGESEIEKTQKQESPKRSHKSKPSKQLKLSHPVIELSYPTMIPIQSSTDCCAGSNPQSTCSFVSFESSSNTATASVSPSVVLEQESCPTTETQPTGTNEVTHQCILSSEVITSTQFENQSDHRDMLGTKSEVEQFPNSEASVTAMIPSTSTLTSISSPTESSDKVIRTSIVLPKMRLKMPPLVPATTPTKGVSNPSPPINLEPEESDSKMPPLAPCGMQQHKGEFRIVQMPPNGIPASGLANHPQVQTTIPVPNQTETEESGLQSQSVPAYAVVWVDQNLESKITY